MNSVNPDERKPPPPPPSVVGANASLMSSRSREHGLSVFHCDLPPGAYVQTDDCLMAVQQCVDALNGWCEAGTRTIAVFLKVLKGTVYAQMAAQLHGAMMHVHEIAAVETMKLQKHLKTNWCQLSRFSGASNLLPTEKSKDSQIIARELMNFVGTTYQLFLNMAQHLGQFINPGSTGGPGVPSVSESCPVIPICQNPIQLPVGSRPGVLGNKSKVVAGGSPAGLRKQVTSFLSKIGQKSPDTSCFYVPLDAEGRNSSSSVATPAGQSCQEGPGCSTKHVEGKSNGGHVATQEDLDLVISMLSQGCRVHVTGMQAIPEHLTTVDDHQPSGMAVRGVNVDNQPSRTVLNLGLEAHMKRPPIHPHPPVGVLLDKSVQNSKSSTEAKMNTWPFKPSQKVLLWPNGDVRMAQNVFSAAGSDSESTREEGNGAQPLQSGTWPVNDARSTATLNNLPTWYNEGLWPTLNMYDTSGIWPSQYSTWNSDRRHSSGEHNLLSQHATLSNPLPGSINISVDAPTDDKYGWTSHLQMMDKMSSEDERGHRTLSMQWSDPLTTQRSLSCWDSGVVPVSKNQLSSTPASSGTYAMKPTAAAAASGGQLDKSF